VARSASESQHPISDACRQVLDAMTTGQHRVVLSKTQYWEWQKHQSGFAKNWLARMMGKKLYVVLNPEADSGLTDRIYRLECTEKTRKEMLKDVHLLESALATDHAVVSQETNVLALFTTHTEALGIPRAVAWVNPAENVTACITWIENGAPVEKARSIPPRA